MEQTPAEILVAQCCISILTAGEAAGRKVMQTIRRADDKENSISLRNGVLVFRPSYVLAVGKSPAGRQRLCDEIIGCVSRDDLPREWLDREEFVVLARQILDRHGVSEDGDRSYEDEIVAIAENYNGLALQVTRQSMPRGGMPGDNPTTMVTHDGEIIRHHGEAAYVVPRMRELVS